MDLISSINVYTVTLLVILVSQSLENNTLAVPEVISALLSVSSVYAASGRFHNLASSLNNIYLWKHRGHQILSPGQNQPRICPDVAPLQGHVYSSSHGKGTPGWHSSFTDCSEKNLQQPSIPSHPTINGWSLWYCCRNSKASLQSSTGLQCTHRALEKAGAS